MMLNMLATLAEYEREPITERVNAGTAAARPSGTVFGRPPVDPVVIADKLGIVNGRAAESRKPKGRGRRNWSGGLERRSTAAGRLRRHYAGGPGWTRLGR